MGMRIQSSQCNIGEDGVHELGTARAHIAEGTQNYHLCDTSERYVLKGNRSAWKTNQCATFTFTLGKLSFDEVDIEPVTESHHHMRIRYVTIIILPCSVVY